MHITIKSFKTPLGTYWLGDASYANTDTILVYTVGQDIISKNRDLVKRNQRTQRNSLTYVIPYSAMLSNVYLVF